MSAALLDAIIHASGAGADVSTPARVELGASGDTLRVRAFSGFGIKEPSTRPTLRLETSSDGNDWTLLVDLGEVGFDPVDATATLPAGVQLRCASDWQPDGDDMLHWAPFVVCQP